MPGIFERFVDNRDPRSLASHFRRRRLRLFLRMIEDLPDPVRILDVGGTEAFWRAAAIPAGRELHITLLNLSHAAAPASAGARIAADCRRIPFAASAFDVVFSNSVIEHVGGPQDQLAMAGEIRRVGRGYFVQTPNRRFPIEPHFVFPLYQFLPDRLQVWLFCNFSLGWMGRAADANAARRMIAGIRLLDRPDLQRLFPDARIEDERVFGLTKSFMAHSNR